MKRVLVLCVLLLSTTFALAKDVRVVLKGYDPVAYFTEGKPVKGDPALSYEWDEGRYHFANAKHRQMFVQNPDKYAPQFGGFCTGSMSRNAWNEADPESFVISDGKLYFFGDKKWKPIAEGDPAYLPSKLPDASKNYEQRRKRS